MLNQTEPQPSNTMSFETGCCPRFDPAPWQDRALIWQKKLFVKDRVRSFFHVPWSLGKVFARELSRIEAAGAQSPEPIVLCDERSPWAADYYFAVSQPVPGAELAEISGTFMTKVFEGPFSKVGEWAAAMRGEVEARGKQLEKLYFWYTTCPACAKAYGKNYVVSFAKVA